MTEAVKANTVDSYPLWHPMTDMRRILGSPVMITSGRGARVTDDQGQEYLSGNAALWNMQCGYDESRITNAIQDQLKKLSYGTLFRYGNEPALQLAYQLVKMSPVPDLTRVYYGTSGSSGVDAALKMARRYQRLTGREQRTTVAALADSYHGTLYGSMAVTGEDLGQSEYDVDMSNVCHVSTPVDAESAASALAELSEKVDTLAAVIVEPILGSCGIVVPHQDFFTGLNDLCRDNDICLIADEVATGFGRTGSMFACEWAGLKPDLIVMSKGINSGYLPMSAVLVHERIWEAFQGQGESFLNGETQAGNPLACAAALATIDVIESDGLVEHAFQAGKELEVRLRKLLPRARGQALPPTGRGLMIGMHLQGPNGKFTLDQSNAVAERFRSLGLIVHPSGLGFGLLPPLIIDDDDIDLIINVTGQVFDELDLS